MNKLQFKSIQDRSGEVATTVTVFALVLMTLGVIIGSALVSNSRLSTTYSEAQSGSSASPAVDDRFEATFDTMRGSGAGEIILPGSICFTGDNPPASSSYKIYVRVYTNMNRENPHDVGSANTEIVSSRSEYQCDQFKDFSALINTNLPEGVAYDDIQEITIELDPQTGFWGDISSNTVIGFIEDKSVLFEPEPENPTQATISVTLENNFSTTDDIFYVVVESCDAGQTPWTANCETQNEFRRSIATTYETGRDPQVFTIDNPTPGYYIRVLFGYYKDGTTKDDSVFTQTYTAPENCLTNQGKHLICPVGDEDIDIDMNVQLPEKTGTVKVDLDVQGDFTEDAYLVEYNIDTCEDDGGETPLNCADNLANRATETKRIKTGFTERSYEYVLEPVTIGSKYTRFSAGLFDKDLDRLGDVALEFSGCDEVINDYQCAHTLGEDQTKTIQVVMKLSDSEEEPTTTPEPTEEPEPTEAPEYYAIMSLYNGSSKRIVKVKTNFCPNGINCVEDINDTDIAPGERGIVEFKLGRLDNSLRFFTLSIAVKLEDMEEQPFGEPLNFSNQENVLYDVTVTDDSVEATGETESTAADVSGNQCVNAEDASYLIPKLAEFFPPEQCIPEDIDCNGVVNMVDYAYIVANLNKGEGCFYNQE